MTTEATIEKMKDIRLSAMAEAYAMQLANIDTYRGLEFDERLAMLIDYESDTRATKKMQRLITSSNMYFKNAAPEQINYSPERKLDKSLFAQLINCTYIDKQHNVILTGPSGSGKTWLSCALGVAACRKYYKVKYYKMRGLIDELMLCRANLDGGYQKLIDNLKKTHLLIIDDFLLHEVSPDDMGELLELVDARLLTGSTIFCSQYKFDGWFKIMGRTPISEAFASRVKASSHMIPVESPDDLRLANRLL